MLLKLSRFFSDLNFNLKMYRIKLQMLWITYLVNRRIKKCHKP
jgi:hypothetical protein